MGGGGSDEELLPEEGRGLGDETLVIRPRHAHVPVVVPGDETLVAHSPDRRASVGDVTNIQECADTIDFRQAPLGDALNGCQG